MSLSSKEEILQSIRKHRMEFQEIPAECTVQPMVSKLSGEELMDEFKQSLKNAGAEVIEVEKEEIGISEEYPADCPLEKLDKIEQIVFRGNFGVAENGAIWLEDKDLSHRLLPFVTQRLILRLDAGSLVPTMQEAYRKIDLRQTGFGVFISGPSKTADIEQSLVYGAHGAKELTVLIERK
jgi:L-lactate dehydrogenase complex protein LldG